MFQDRKSSGAAKNAASSIHNNTKKSIQHTSPPPALAAVHRSSQPELSVIETSRLKADDAIALGPFSIAHDLLELVPYETALRHQFVPIEHLNNDLTVAVSEPLDNYDLTALSKEIGLHLIPVNIGKPELSLALRNYSKAYFNQKILHSLTMPRNTSLKTIHTHMDGVVDETPVVQLMNYLLSQAVMMDASDIHIEPQKEHVRIRLRIDGCLVDLMNLPSDIAPAMISRIKIMSNLDISERRQPQDGRIRAMVNGDEIHFRVSTIPAVHGEKAVLRILNRLQKWMSIDRLGLEKYNRKLFFDLLKSTRGMILVAGPTGSGKTSTMYAMLDYLNKTDRNIITLEDPIECTIPGITQVQINNKTGLTFAKGLRSVLRQDPDIIMVGEIRDMETAELAIRAALTGHLVLSTIHTASACGAITRLIDMGIESYLIAAALSGVISQRLVRRICPECKEQHMPTFEDMEPVLDQASSGESYFKGVGCELCVNTGYQGRLALQEILVVDKEIGSMVSGRAMENDIEEKAVDNGMIGLFEDGLRKARKGITSMEEVWKETYV
ncbi:MAG: GspE/PulE family protein [Acidobacteriota bacterium]